LGFVIEAGIYSPPFFLRPWRERRRFGWGLGKKKALRRESRSSGVGGDSKGSRRGMTQWLDLF